MPIPLDNGPLPAAAPPPEQPKIDAFKKLRLRDFIFAPVAAVGLWIPGYLISAVAGWLACGDAPGRNYYTCAPLGTSVMYLLFLLIMLVLAPLATSFIFGNKAGKKGVLKLLIIQFLLFLLLLILYLLWAVPSGIFRTTRFYIPGIGIIQI
ncbi:MAG: hypothetical protein ACM3IJ_00190 [Candidatus Levyibacteriota bacterium]